MRATAFAVLGLLTLVPALVFGQSLGELATKEKERREKNKQSGKAVRVITDSDLRKGEEASGSGQGSETTSAQPPASSASSSRSSSSVVEEVEEDEAGAEGASKGATEIPREGSLESRIQAFEAVKKTYQQEVAKIDGEIAKNKNRLVEIEERLATLGAAGGPLAPPPDMTPGYDGEFFGLMDEKGKLQARNLELEAQKESLWRELVEKARRAGIPPGYLRK